MVSTWRCQRPGSTMWRVDCPYMFWENGANFRNLLLESGPPELCTLLKSKCPHGFTQGHCSTSHFTGSPRPKRSREYNTYPNACEKDRFPSNEKFLASHSRSIFGLSPFVWKHGCLFTDKSCFLLSGMNGECCLWLLLMIPFLLPGFLFCLHGKFSCARWAEETEGMTPPDTHLHIFDLPTGRPVIHLTSWNLHACHALTEPCHAIRQTENSTLLKSKTGRLKITIIY